MAEQIIPPTATPCPYCQGTGQVLLLATWTEPEDHADCMDCAATGVMQPQLWTPDEEDAYTWAPEPAETVEARYRRQLVRAWLDAPNAEAAMDVVIALGRGVA